MIKESLISYGKKAQSSVNWLTQHVSATSLFRGSRYVVNRKISLDLSLAGSFQGNFNKSIYHTWWE